MSPPQKKQHKQEQAAANHNKRVMIMMRIMMKDMSKRSEENARMELDYIVGTYLDVSRVLKWPYFFNETRYILAILTDMVSKDIREVLRGGGNVLCFGDIIKRVEGFNLLNIGMMRHDVKINQEAEFEYARAQLLFKVKKIAKYHRRAIHAHMCARSATRALLNKK